MNNKSRLLLEEDNNETLRSFRRRNKTLIIILTTFFMPLALTTTAFSFYLLHRGFPETAESISENTAVRIFFSNAACDNPSCKEAFNSILINKSIVDPTQILRLSLQAASEQLDDVISSFMSDETTAAAFKNCSDPLRSGSGLIREALEVIRVNPSPEIMRFGLMHKISAAEEDLKACVDDLGNSTAAASELIARVHRVMVYVSTSGEFVYYYRKVSDRRWSEYDALRDVVGVCIFVLEGWFIFVVFRKIWRSR
ncbi:hypothetical protein ABFS83_09G036400 [Erythranthe nasuta]